MKLKELKPGRNFVFKDAIQGAGTTFASAFRLVTVGISVEEASVKATLPHLGLQQADNGFVKVLEDDAAVLEHEIIEVM